MQQLSLIASQRNLSKKISLNLRLVSYRNKKRKTGKKVRKEGPTFIINKRNTSSARGLRFH